MQSAMGMGNHVRSIIYKIRHNYIKIYLMKIEREVTNCLRIVQAVGFFNGHDGTLVSTTAGKTSNSCITRWFRFIMSLSLHRKIIGETDN
jgi:hypothetical protein